MWFFYFNFLLTIINNYFSFFILNDVLKSKSSYFLFNKNKNFNKNETELKMENPTQAVIETNHVLQLK